MVLAGVGIFLLKVGLGMVESTKANTIAVVGLTAGIGKLCEQQAAANQLVQSQMAAHMATLLRELDILKEEVRDAAGRSRKGNPNPGNGNI